MPGDSQIVIRDLRTSDRAEWRDLWRAYLDFYDTTRPDEVYSSSFARLTDPQQPDYRGYVSERDGRLSGLVHFIFHRHGWHVGEVCYLQDLFVTPAARGTGAGRALMEAVFSAADAAGAPEVYWLTQDFNTGARRLYDRIGQVTPFIKYRR